MTYFNDIYIKTIAFSINKDRHLLDYKTKIFTSTEYDYIFISYGN